jgi:hypothetical protein
VFFLKLIFTMTGSMVFLLSMSTSDSNTNEEEVGFDAKSLSDIKHVTIR